MAWTVLGMRRSTVLELLLRCVRHERDGEPGHVWLPGMNGQRPENYPVV